MTKETREYRVLYIGDNGRLTCPDLRCAGMTAHYSGMNHDISGERMQRLSPADVRSLAEILQRQPTCEGCGAEASMILA